MFVTINDTQYNTLEFTAYRVLSTKEHPIGVEVHFVGGMKLIKDFDTEAEREEFISILGSTYVELSNIFYNAMYFTAYYKEDVVLDSSSYNVVAHYNGPTKLVFKFETEAARDEFVEKLDAMSLGGMTQKDTFADFPKTGSSSGIYLAKDTGQMYFWDEVLKTYEKLGVSRKGGVYSYNNVINNTIGHISTIKKSDLTELVKPSVAFMDGSEVIGNNSVRGVITSSDAETVTVRTITDLVIDSFVQVDTEADLPEQGAENVLYYLKDRNVVVTWNGEKYLDLNSEMVNGYKLFIIPQGGNSMTWLNTHAYDFAKKHGWDKIIYIQITSIGDGKNSYPRLYVPQKSTATFISFICMDENELLHRERSSNSSMVYTYGTGNYQIDAEGKLSGYSYGTSDVEVGLNFLSTDKNYSKPYMPKYDGSPATKKYVDIADKRIQSEVISDLTREVESLPNDIVPVDYTGTETATTTIYKDALDAILTEKQVTRPYSDALTFMKNKDNQALYGKYYLTCSYGKSNWTNTYDLGFMSNDPDMFTVGSSTLRFHAEYDETKPVYLISMKSGKIIATLITAKEQFEPYYNSVSFNLTSVNNNNLQIHTNANLRLSNQTKPYKLYSQSSGGELLRTVSGDTPIIRVIDDAIYPLPASGSYTGTQDGSFIYCDNQLYKVVINPEGGPVEYRPVIATGGILLDFRNNTTEAERVVLLNKWVNALMKGRPIPLYAIYNKYIMTLDHIYDEDKLVVDRYGNYSLQLRFTEVGNGSDGTIINGINYRFRTTYKYTFQFKQNDDGSYEVLGDFAFTELERNAYMEGNKTADYPLGGSNTSVYEPKHAYNPATKKYVDDAVKSLQIFEGDEDEYNALTQEEKDAFLIAIVNPLVDPENPVVETINEIAGDESETEIDLTDEELEGAMDEIIGG